MQAQYMLLIAALLFHTVFSSPITITSFTPLNPIVDQGQYETIIAQWSGGTPPYAVNLYIANSINGNAIINVTVEGVEITSQAFSFAVPVTHDSLGNPSIRFSVRELSEPQMVAVLSPEVPVLTDIPVQQPAYNTALLSTSQFYIPMLISGVFAFGIVRMMIHSAKKHAKKRRSR